MKKSRRLLLITAVQLFTWIIILIIHSRVQLNRLTRVTDGETQAHRTLAVHDTLILTAPPLTINPFAITYGIDRGFLGSIDTSGNIFSSLGMVYREYDYSLMHSYLNILFFPTAALLLETSFYDTSVANAGFNALLFYKKASDGVKWEDRFMESVISDRQTYKLLNTENGKGYQSYIHIGCARAEQVKKHILSYAAYDPFGRNVYRIERMSGPNKQINEKRLLLNPPRNHKEYSTGDAYYTQYLWRDKAVCYWELNGWATSIIVPLAVVKDTTEAIVLRDKIRERVLEYYSELN